MKIKAYHYASSVDEVVELLEKSRKNVILGGTHWLKMGKAHYNMGIDISRLGLDEITEFEDRIELGAFVSLRQIETDPRVKAYAQILCQSVEHIVGVQFRNTARIGASVYSRYGFSDVVTALMTLDAYIEINGHKQVRLTDYVTLPREKHFVTKIVIYKEKRTFAYHAMRKSKTDLAYIIVAMSKDENNHFRIAVGARPRGSMLATKTMAYLNGNEMTSRVIDGMGSQDEEDERLKEGADLLCDEAGFASNCYAGKSYRQHLSKVFFERGVQSLWK